jgi:hypothetical protein
MTGGERRMLHLCSAVGRASAVQVEGVQLELQREFEGLQREWIKGRQDNDVRLNLPTQGQ